MSQGTEELDGSTSVNKVLLNQCLNVSNYMYYGQYTPFTTAYTTQYQTDLGLEPLEVNGNIVENTIAKDGLFEEAFVTTGTGPEQIIIGYEGTNGINLKNPNPVTFGKAQIKDDGCIVDGEVAPSFAPAASFAQHVLTIAGQQGISSSDVYLTGHSLGAAEAEYASAETGLSGFTFGTPGIVAPTNAKPATLQNYVDNGDPVGNYANDGPDLYGASGTSPAIIHSPAIKHYGATTTYLGPTSNEADLKKAIAEYRDYDPFFLKAFKDSIYYHHLSTYAQSLETKYGKQNIDLYSIDDQQDGSTAAGLDFVEAVAPQLLGAPAPCFAGGTRIRTADGDRPVEQLAVGDLVRTASGELRPISWLGHRTVDCARYPDPREVRPVRIVAGAFGPARPARDLLVSPGHAICVDAMGEVLIPAAALIDGDSVVQLDVAHVTYWHVELPTHDILLAENLPAESYLEMGNRGFFAEAAAVALHAGPDAGAVTHAAFCRPFVTDGPLLAAVRAVRARAAKVTGSRRDTSAAA